MNEIKLQEYIAARQAVVALADSRKGRIYIAGPMTGYENYNFAAFNEAAQKLRNAGFVAVNPADHGIVTGADWPDYLRDDIAKLATCEAIHFLPGWSKSKGATLEHHIAVALAMDIQFAEEAERQPVGQEPVLQVVEGPGEHRPRVTRQLRELPPIGSLLYAAPPAQAVDLAKLERFDPAIYQGALGVYGEMEKLSDGDWVRFEDVEALIDGKAVQS